MVGPGTLMRRFRRWNRRLAALFAGKMILSKDPLSGGLDIGSELAGVGKDLFGLPVPKIPVAVPGGSRDTVYDHEHSNNLIGEADLTISARCETGAVYDMWLTAAYKSRWREVLIKKDCQGYGDTDTREFVLGKDETYRLAALHASCDHADFGGNPPTALIIGVDLELIGREGV